MRLYLLKQRPYLVLNKNFLEDYLTNTCRHKYEYITNLRYGGETYRFKCIEIHSKTPYDSLHSYIIKSSIKSEYVYVWWMV